MTICKSTSVTRQKSLQGRLTTLKCASVVDASCYQRAVSEDRSVALEWPLLMAESGYPDAVELPPARLVAGFVTVLWVKNPLLVSRLAKLSLPSLWGR